MKGFVRELFILLFFPVIGYIAWFALGLNSSPSWNNWLDAIMRIIFLIVVVYSSLMVITSRIIHHLRWNKVFPLTVIAVTHSLLLILFCYEQSMTFPLYLAMVLNIIQTGSMLCVWMRPKSKPYLKEE